MPTTDPRIDAYIAKAAPFAQPILARIRAAFHQGSPDLVETIKWGAPHFTKHGILGSMMAFQKHVSFGFWRGTEIDDPKGILTRVGNTRMAAAKVTDLQDLPSQTVLAGYVKRAAKLDAQVGAGARPKKKAAKKAAKKKR